MKRYSILLFALFCAACTKQNVAPLGTFNLYNDPQQRVKMVVSDNSVSFFKNDSLLSVVESGINFDVPFTMPANVWENPLPVTGTWSVKYSFLEFSYVAPNRDSSLVAYLPTETYFIDFFKP